MDHEPTQNPILPGAGVPRSAAEVHLSPSGLYDGLPLNSPEGGRPENQMRPKAAPKTKILRCKHPLKLSTFNIRTLKVKDIDSRQIDAVLKTNELCNKLKQYGIEICGIQETRIKHPTEERNTIAARAEAFGYTLHTASAWENDAQAATGGLGIILGKTAEDLLISVERLSDRIIKARFRGNPAMTVIVAYAPTENATEDDKDIYYNHLRAAIEDVPLHNFLAVLTDANARLGPADALFAYDKETNRNGKRLLEIMEDYQLLAANTLFQKGKGKQWTWKSPLHTYHQMDYILVRSKWRNSVTNCEAYNTFGSLYSDHRVVTASVTLSLRKSKPSNAAKVTRYNWSDLATNNELQESYEVEVRNRYQVLQVEDEDGHKVPDYDKFLSACTEAAEKCLTKVPKQKKKDRSLDPRVKAVREEVEQAYKAYLADSNKESLCDKYKDKKKELFNTYAIIEEEELISKIKRVELAHERSQHGEAWKLINSVTGRKSAQSSKLKADSPEERVKLWHTHFYNLLGNPPVISEEDTPIKTVSETVLEISEEPFTEAEYAKAKKAIRCGKACGNDGITPELLKYGGLDDVLLGFVNEAYESGHIPEQWKTLIIVTVPKSGDLTKPDNYRGISLISVVMKLYNRMLLNRLRPVLDPLLRNSQNGFRQGRTTVGHLLAIRRLLEGVKRHNLSCAMTFIDFKKAFDTIHRGKLMDILRAYGVPEKVVTAIAATYSQTWAKVRTPDGETEPFQILAGVLQGDTLAPFLFIIALDYALRSAIDGKEEELGFTLATQKSKRIRAKMITDLDFADDINLISDTVEKASKLLAEVERQCRMIGLQINSKKTKFMPLNAGDETVATLDGSLLEVVDDYKYLGGWIASTEHDIKVRRALAWKALHSMQRVWRSTMDDKLKRRLFVATVESVLLYGAETWTLTVQLEKALDGVYTRMLRIALNVSWEDHMRNIELYGDLPRLSDKIRERRMGFAAHCLRHPELPAGALVLWEPDRVNGRVSKRDTYIDNLKRDVGLPKTKETTGELQNLMENEGVWGRRIHDSRVGVT